MEFEGVTANAVRLFKYLVPDYYEDLKRSTEVWVCKTVDVVARAPGQPQAASDSTSKLALLQSIYTKHVIPDELLELWTNSTPDGKLQTSLREGEDMAAGRERIHSEWVRFILTNLLQVDGHPTLSRFFTFRGCVDRMLTLALLEFPATGGLNLKPSAREDSQKRVKRVRHFFTKSAAGQALRRASLVLQLTSGVEGFMSAKPKEGSPPTVVAIQQGRAHDILNLRLQHLLEVAGKDPDLKLGAATGALLATAGDLNARLNAFMKYPYKFVVMCRKWFPMSHKHAITEFLKTAPEGLDAGFSLQLQLKALAENGEIAQRAFLMRRDVQEMLEGAADAFFSNSLEAERAAAEVKRREGRNITLLANVSRDLLCRRFTKQREEQAAAIEDAENAYRKLKQSSWNAIAWEKHDAAPDGLQFKRQPASAGDSEMPATRGRPVRPATGGHPGTSGSSEMALASAGCLKRPRSRFESSVATASQEKALCKAERSRRIEEARIKLEVLRAPSTIIPCTRLQWAAWLRTNLEELRQRMQKDAAPHRRRAFNIRTTKRPGLPHGQRVQPQADKSCATSEWGKLLQWRDGWHGLQAASGRRMFYLLRHLQTTYVIVMETFRQPAGSKYPYHLGKDFDIRHHMRPLTTLESMLENDVIHHVYEFRVEGSAGPMSATGGKPATGGIFLKPSTAVEITTPANYRKVSATQNAEREAEDSCEDLGHVHHPSDIGEDGIVVDTDEPSCDESGNTTLESSEELTDSEDDKAIVAKKPATGGSAPATDGVGPATGGVKPAYKKSGASLFDNGYFYIKGHETHLRIYIFSRSGCSLYQWAWESFPP
jgi:hypothetical protein